MNEDMSLEIIEMFGPVIEVGQVGDVTYEVRGDEHPMVYVYRKVGGTWKGKLAHLGNTPIRTLVKTVAAGIPRK